MNKCAGLLKLCQDQDWDKQDVARMLDLSPNTVYKMMLPDYDKEILPNDFRLLQYIAKYGGMD